MSSQTPPNDDLRAKLEAARLRKEQSHEQSNEDPITPQDGEQPHQTSHDSPADPLDTTAPAQTTDIDATDTPMESDIVENITTKNNVTENHDAGQGIDKTPTTDPVASVPSETTKPTNHPVPSTKPTDVAAHNPFYHPAGQTVAFLREAQGDPARIAKQLRSGELALNGAGDAGRIFRSAMEESPEVMGSVWGEILALCASLWEIKAQDEAIILIETGLANFHTPDVWRKEAEAALKMAQDYRVAQDVEEALTEGNDTQAMTLAMTIQDPEAEAYQGEIQTRIKKRKKSRMIAFSVAGIAITGLLTISAIGIMTMDRLYQPIPPVTLDMNGALDDISRSLREQRSLAETQTIPAPDLTPLTTPGADDPLMDILSDPAPAATDTQQVPATSTPIPETPTPLPPETVTPPIPAPTPIPEQAPSTPLTQPQPSNPEVLTDLTGSTQDSPSFQPVTPPTSTAPSNTTAPSVAPTTQEPTTVAPTTPPVEQPVLTPEQVRQNNIDDCILGFGVMARMQDMATTQQFGADILDRMNTFSAMLDQACTPLQIPPMDLVRGTTMLDPNTVERVLNNYFFN